MNQKASQTSRPNRLLVTKEITIVDHAATGAAMRAYRRLKQVPVDAFMGIGIGSGRLRLMENGSYHEWDAKTVESRKRIIDNYSERIHANAGIEQED